MKIEKGVPLWAPLAHRDKYGIVDLMEVGDSILFEGYQASHAAVVRARKGKPERKFASRKENSGYRIWRVE